MDHAVRRFDVRRHHVGLFDHHAVVEVDGDRRALNGCRFHVVRQIARHHFARHHVVGEDRGQLVDVLRLEQIFNGTFRQRCERFVGRGKDGERTFALQRFDKTGSFDSSDQRAECARFLSGTNDVFLHATGKCRGSDCKSGRAAKQDVLHNGSLQTRVKICRCLSGISGRSYEASLRLDAWKFPPMQFDEGGGRAKPGRFSAASHAGSQTCYSTGASGPRNRTICL